MAIIDVSVVVCTYNRAKMLADTLRSLIDLRTDGRIRFEIVVVDNASTDHTGQVIAAAARASHVPIRGVVEYERGVAAARNRGLSEALGQWIAFCDDDQVADPDWLRELLVMARKTGARLIGGAIRLQLPEPGRRLATEIRAMMGESVGMDREQRYTRRNSPGTGNMLVHRSVFNQVGAFDQNLQEAGEDTDLFRRVRAAQIETWYTPAAIVRHVIPPYRLKEEYLRWSSQRTGWCFAHRDQQEWGRAKVFWLLTARVGKAALVLLPWMLFCRLTRRRETSLGIACRIWRVEGYFRCALKLLAPAWFEQRHFLSKIEFRAERSAYAQEG